MKREEGKIVTVTCVVCKDTVTRRSTLMTSGGRACRKHPGVKDDAQQMQHDLEDVHAAGRVRRQK